MDYHPNIDGVLLFAKECWPLIQSECRGATWQIVGRSPPPSVCRLGRLPNVSVTGAVPDVRPYLAAASVVVAPLRIGSGTRLKILEGLAMGKAVVATHVACEGLAVTEGKHLVVADEPASFSRAVIELLKDAEKRNELGTAGRRLAESYSWSRSAQSLIDTIETLTGPGKSACRS